MDFWTPDRTLEQGRLDDDWEYSLIVRPASLDQIGEQADPMTEMSVSGGSPGSIAKIDVQAGRDLIYGDIFGFVLQYVGKGEVEHQTYTRLRYGSKKAARRALRNMYLRVTHRRPIDRVIDSIEHALGLVEPAEDVR